MTFCVNGSIFVTSFCCFFSFGIAKDVRKNWILNGTKFIKNPDMKTSFVGDVNGKDIKNKPVHEKNILIFTPNKFFWV